MSSVISRKIQCSPFRNTSKTWEVIVDLLTSNNNSTQNRQELLSVGGVVACILSEQAPEKSPIIVTCDGTRTRIYCLYGENALDDSEANEDKLTYDALKGDWSISLPCIEDDLEWVQKELSNLSKRITARNMSEKTIEKSDNSESSSRDSFVVNMEAFLKP